LSECSFGEDHCGVVIELEAENAKLKEALREFITAVRPECEQDCELPCSYHVACQIRKVLLAKAREVLGDA
jgi:hypothetical protein